MTRGIDLAARKRREYPAAGFVLVGAVVKPALLDVRPKLRKTALDFLVGEVQQPKGLESRRVDEIADIARQVIEASCSRRVLPGAQCDRVLPGRRQGIRDPPRRRLTAIAGLPHDPPRRRAAAGGRYPRRSLHKQT